MHVSIILFFIFLWCIIFYVIYRALDNEYYNCNSLVQVIIFIKPVELLILYYVGTILWLYITISYLN